MKNFITESRIISNYRRPSLLDGNLLDQSLKYKLSYQNGSYE